MGEEPVMSLESNSPSRGILKNKPSEDRIPVKEPNIVPEKATILCPGDGIPCSGSNGSSRDFLLHKRSSLTHTPDIARVFGGGNKASGDGSRSNSLHEFQKVKLRHVDSSETEERKRDVLISLSPGPCKFDCAVEGGGPKRSSSFTQPAPGKTTEVLPKEMSTSMTSRRPLIMRGESNASLPSSKKRSSLQEEKKTIVRESLANKSNDKSSSVSQPPITDTGKTVSPPKRPSLTPSSPKRKDSNEPRNSSPSGKDASPTRSSAKPSSTSRNNKVSKENKMPVKSSSSTSKNKKEEPKISGQPELSKGAKPSSSVGGNTTLKKSPPSPKPSKKRSSETAVPKPAVPKKTPEVRRRVVPKPSSLVDPLKAKTKSSPSQTRRKVAPLSKSPEPKSSPSPRRKVAPNPTTTTTPEPPKKKAPSKEDPKASEPGKKRSERVSGIFRPTQSWLCYMGDKVELKSRAPSPGATKGSQGEVRKRSTEQRKSSAPIRRTESFNSSKQESKKKNSSCSDYGSVKRSSSLRSNSSGRGDPEKRGSSFNSTTKRSIPPPTLPKPGKANPKEEGIEETSIKASSVIQKFEAVTESNVGRRSSSFIGSSLDIHHSETRPSFLPSFPSSSSPSEDPAKYSPSMATPDKDPFCASLSPTMVTSEEYTTQRMQSHSRSGSIVSGGEVYVNGGSNNNGGHVSGEKYKTTMVVRLHPGQTRKLSNCSTTTTTNIASEDQGSSHIFDREETSDHRKLSSSSNYNIKESLSFSTLESQEHIVSAELHDSSCDKTDSCCASGLEITFESAPQTIDIKLIPSPSVEERKNLDSEEDGSNLITQETTNKTRQ